MVVRVFTNPDGTVRVMRATERGVSFDFLTERIPGLKGLPYVDIDEDELPQDRTQRALWRVVGGRVTVFGVPVTPR